MLDDIQIQIHLAVRELARAAAMMEREGIGAEQTWFVVRALCAEHGLQYDEFVRAGRSFVTLNYGTT